MKIGYFCYYLSGTGPRTRAADIIEAVSKKSDHNVVVLTQQPDKVRGSAVVHPVAIDSPVHLLRTARRAFADADIVHTPINVYQALFVRLVYSGPLVGGVGPGIQISTFHRYLGRLIGIDKKIKVHKTDTKWEDAGYDTAICTATIDRDVFYPYEEDRVDRLRAEHGIKDETVILYVGVLSEEQGAHLVDKMAHQTRDDDSIKFIVIGDGPLTNSFRNRDDLVYEGFLDNKLLPDYYNLADVTVAPRENDNTSNVGLESIACGTPMITTAEGTIVELFKDRKTYIWADRTPEAVLEAVQDLMSDPEFYQAQVERGFETMNELDLTLDAALKTHLGVYNELAKRS
jgi:glycosyltransferase involved in cell wall biosynthesis